MKSLLSVLRVLPIFVLSACATTDASNDSDKPIVELRTNCTRAESVEIDIGKFSTNPEPYIGRCVHARGIIADRSFFPSLQVMYNSRIPPERKIAISGDNETLWGMRKFVDIVAFAYSCQELGRSAQAKADRQDADLSARGEEAGTLVFIAGNCHYFSSPVLHVSERAPVEGEPVRLTGASTGRSFGNLIEIQTTSPSARTIRDHIQTRLDFIRARDFDGLKNFMRADGLSEEDAQEAIRYLLLENDAPFAFLAGVSTPPVVRYFGIKGEPRSARNFDSYRCVCKTADCEGLWPISSLDTEKRPEWPYSCMHVRGIEGDVYLD